MTALFQELIDVPQFLVNNALSSSDSNVIRKESTWPANEETGYGAPTPTPGAPLGRAGSDTPTYVHMRCFVNISLSKQNQGKVSQTLTFFA